MLGKIHSIETFGTVDGPGVRYVIFTQGCPLRCAYCHNPDSQSLNGGELMELDALVMDIKRYLSYIEGITVTGGEPLLQIEFVTELFKKVKELGLTTALDTAGSVFNPNDQNFKERLTRLLNVTDLVMLDIKHIDSIEHKKLTGAPNENILEFCKFVDEEGVDIWLRYVLVPTINDSEKHLKDWKKFANGIKNLKKIEILPYHTLGVPKYKELGLEYKLEGVESPTEESLNLAKSILLSKEKF